MKQEVNYPTRIKFMESIYLEKIKRFFLRLTFDNGNRVIYDIEGAETLSSLGNKIYESNYSIKFYNEEIKGRFPSISRDEVIELSNKENFYNEYDGKIEFLKELEAKKEKLLKELKEIRKEWNPIKFLKKTFNFNLLDKIKMNYNKIW